MKTPRDILLAHHGAANPHLDAIRHSVVDGLNHKEIKEQSLCPALIAWLLGCSKVCWQELFFPTRRLWAGMATIWMFILIVNFSQRDNVSSVTGKPIRPGGPVMSLQAQQRWMNELFADRAVSPEANRSRNFSPKPRTQAAEITTV